MLAHSQVLAAKKIMESLAGNLLIAIPDLNDQNFSRTVILVVQHDDQGASGLVLNRPSEVTITQVWDEVSAVPCDCQDLIYMGGPINGPLIALHQEFHSGETCVYSGCNISVGRESLDLLVNQSEAKFRVYSGYSGWGPGQLEQELEQGDWLTYPAAPHHAFNSPGGLWRHLCEQIGEDVLGRHVGKIMPTDSAMN